MSLLQGSAWLNSGPMKQKPKYPKIGLSYTISDSRFASLDTAQVSWRCERLRSPRAAIE